MGLTYSEKYYLYAMVPSYKTGVMLYRATRDGFTAKAFHDGCDGKEKTATVIRNNLNFVFGGFTLARWSSTAGLIPDPNAFIFSLRRNGTFNNVKLDVKSMTYALGGGSSIGPTFGHTNTFGDIYIRDQSNTNTGSRSNLGYAYVSPAYPDGSNSITYLTGGDGNWLTTEIEVYQLSSSG